MIAGIIIATAAFIILLFLLSRADERACESLSESLLAQERENLEKIELDMQLLVEQAKSGEVSNEKKIKKTAAKLKKKRDEAQKRLSDYEAGKIGFIDCIPLIGYGLIQWLRWDMSTDFVKKLIQSCSQFERREHAIRHGYYLIAALVGNIAFGIVVGFALFSLGLAMGMGTRSIVMLIAGVGIFAMIGYIPLDAVRVKVKDRDEQVERQFPRAISKMTLLVSAGLEVNQAWRLVCATDEGVLYEEMRRTNVDLENNMSPILAYRGFMDRCNNKFVTKFATGILQNISKGNSEIVRMFQTLNDECWSERKHGARRMAEVVQSKLMVPTILMFLGIIIMIIVPVMSGFNVL